MWWLGNCPTIWLNVHIFIKWNSWEKSWMVNAAFTRHLRSRLMAACMTWIIPCVVGDMASFAIPSSSPSKSSAGKFNSRSAWRHTTRCLKDRCTASARRSWALNTRESCYQMSQEDTIPKSSLKKPGVKMTWCACQTLRSAKFLKHLPSRKQDRKPLFDSIRSYCKPKFS